MKLGTELRALAALILMIIGTVLMLEGGALGVSVFIFIHAFLVVGALVWA